MKQDMKEKQKSEIETLKSEMTELKKKSEIKEKKISEMKTKLEGIQV